VLLKAIAESCGKTLSGVKSAVLGARGDVIDAACSLRTSQRRLFAPRPLDFSKTYSMIKNISLLGGKELPRRYDMVKKLMVEVQDQDELRFIMRSLQGSVRRAGYSISFVIRALAKALAHEAPHGRQAGTAQPHADGNSTDTILSAHHNDKNKQDAAWLAEEVEGVIHEAISHVPNLDTVVTAAVEHGPGAGGLADCGCS
jgi:hypothetical protein